jgi:anti-sigma B factor antagonist
MKIDVKTAGGVSVVAVQGTIDGNTAPRAQDEILPLIQAGCKLLMDMSAVDYMSSAGLRMMLMLYRRVSGTGGRIVLSGVSEEIKDTMELTGFLDFFTTTDTAESGIAALAG